MLSTLGDPILPIFAVLAAGYVLAKMGATDTGHAASINRFVFYIATPALVVSVLGSARLDEIVWPPVLVYFVAQLAIYAAVFCLMRFVFRREAGESLLLGMAAVFSNHVFFVLPISERFFGEDAARAMAGIVLLDIAVFFCGSVILTQLATADRGEGNAFRRLASNPFVYTPPIGLLIAWLGDLVPSGIWTYLTFTSAAAAPVALFTLGLTLAAAPIFPIRLPCWSVAGAKLVLHPLLVWAGLLAVAPPLGATENQITLLTAAGPCGAMPFVIATQYGVRTGTIAKTILISTVLSLFSLSVLLP